MRGRKMCDEKKFETKICGRKIAIRKSVPIDPDTFVFTLPEISLMVLSIEIFTVKTNEGTIIII